MISIVRILADRDARELLALSTVEQTRIGSSIFIKNISGDFDIKVSPKGYFNFATSDRGDYYRLLLRLIELKPDQALVDYLEIIKQHRQHEAENLMGFINRVEVIFPTKN